MSVDAQPVASSATPEPVTPLTAAETFVSLGDVAGYRDARRAERAGTPLSVDPPSPSASAADEPAEQAGEVAPSSVPASEPGQPSGQKSNAETRKAKLHAEIDALLKQRADLRRDMAPAPAPTVNAEPASPPAPAATGDQPPQLSTFEADPAAYPDPYAAYVEARAAWRAEQTIRTALAAQTAQAAQEKAAQALEVRSAACKARIESALAADAALRERISFETFDVVPSSALPAGKATTQSDLAEAVLSADAPVPLMVLLSESPETLQALLASPDPRTFWRQLGQIEGGLREPAARRPPKVITDAPEPPQTVGTRSVAGSETDAAVRAGDVAAYRAARLRERTAHLR